jgi:hypothetical protein
VAGGRRKASHRKRRRGLAIGIAVLIVAGVSGLVWLLLAPRVGIGMLAAENAGLTEGATASNTPAASKAHSHKATSGDLDAASVDNPSDEAVEKCRSAARVGVDAVEAADDSVDDWAAHIQAMADLEAGRNTEAETKAIWTTTRSEGPGRVAVFERATGDYQDVRAVCADLDTSDLSADQQATVDGCRVLGEETDKALSAARNAVAEWKAHLTAMAERRSGHLDPDVAMTTWMAAYEKAPANIDAFHEAEAAFRAARADCATPKR